MKQKKGPWDGAQLRGHVLKVLREHGVLVERLDDVDQYELVDLDGDPEVLIIPAVVLSEMIVHIYRRFGQLHGFEITDLVAPNRKH